MERSLDEIAVEAGTDKSRLHHGYTRLYERYLGSRRDQPIALLEIGVANGASLRMWSEYFWQAHIFGVDIDQRCNSVPAGRAKVLVGDQSNPWFLSQVLRQTGPLDIVIDDGSHVGEHQIRSFECLFPALNPGGLYVIEDVHTAYWGWGRRNAILYFKNLVDSVMAYGKSECADIANDPNYRRLRRQLGYFERNVESVHFYRSLIFIHRHGGVQTEARKDSSRRGVESQVAETRMNGEPAIIGSALRHARSLFLHRR